MRDQNLVGHGIGDQNSMSAAQIKQSLQAQSLRSAFGQVGAPATEPISMTESVMAELATQQLRLRRLVDEIESSFAPVIREQSCAEELSNRSPSTSMPPLLARIRDITEDLTNNLSRIQSVIDRSAL